MVELVLLKHLLHRLPNHDDGWCEKHDKHTRKNEKHQWENHLDRGFCSLLFRLLSALQPQRIRKVSERSRNRRSESFCLDQHIDERAHNFQSRTIGETLPRFNARLAGPLFHVDQQKFVAQLWVADLQFLSYADKRLVHTEAGFHTNDQQVECIRK